MGDPKVASMQTTSALTARASSGTARFRSFTKLCSRERRDEILTCPIMFAMIGRAASTFLLFGAFVIACGAGCGGGATARPSTDGGGGATVRDGATVDAAMADDARDVVDLGSAYDGATADVSSADTAIDALADQSTRDENQERPVDARSDASVDGSPDASPDAFSDAAPDSLADALIGDAAPDRPAADVVSDVGPSDLGPSDVAPGDLAPGDVAPADAALVIDALHGDGAVVAPGLAPTCTASGWCWSNPLPQGEQLEVWAASATDAWGVGPLGIIRHFDGTNWTGMASGVAENLFGVWGAASDDVWAVGAKGLVMHWTGSSWTQLARLTTGTLFAVRGRSASDVWIGAQGGELFHYDGAQWTKATSGITTTIEDIAETSDGTVFLLGQLNGTVMRRRPGETAFTHIDYKAEAGSTSLDHLWASGPNDLWATGVSGVFRHNGTTWTPVDLGSGYTMTVRGTGPNDVWLFGDVGAATHYDGAKFERWDVGTAQPLDRAFARAPGDVWVTGWQGGLIRIQPSGVTRYTSGVETAALFGAWSIDADDVLALGSDGFIGRYHAATGWQKMVSNTKFALRAAWGSGPNDIWAVGDSGVILHWLGSSWTAVSSGTLSDLYAVWGAAPDDVWAVGAGGAIQRWNGTRWSTASPASNTFWKGVWGSAANDVWLIGNIGDTWRWNGTAFSKTITTNTSGVWGRSRDEVYSWGQGKVTRWNGSTWIDLALPNPNARLGISMSVNGGPTGDIWVVADGEVTRWNGSAWSPPERLIYSYLESVVVTATDVWAVGGHNQILKFR